MTAYLMDLVDMIMTMCNYYMIQLTHPTLLYNDSLGHVRVLRG